MNSPQKIAELIRIQTTLQKISIRTMLKDIGLGVSSLSHMDSGSMPRADNLGKVALYLNVSADYLLGLTDEPNGYNNNENSFNIGNNSTQTVGNYNNISTGKTNEISDDAREIDNILKSLSPKERVRFLSKIYDLEEEFKKKIT